MKVDKPNITNVVPLGQYIDNKLSWVQKDNFTWQSKQKIVNKTRYVYKIYKIEVDNKKMIFFQCKFITKGESFTVEPLDGAKTLMQAKNICNKHWIEKQGKKTNENK